MRGKGDRSVMGNFEQYNLTKHFLGAMTFDLTNNPLRKDLLFDAIVSDRNSPSPLFPNLPLPFLNPVHVLICAAPYGVRAGAKRLGSKKDMSTPIIRKDGTIAHEFPPQLTSLKIDNQTLYTPRSSTNSPTY